MLTDNIRTNFCATCKEQADTIEAQAAEIERLEKEVAQAWCDDAMPCRQLLDAKQDNERLNHANQELQSENARMREAGTKLAGYAGHDDNCEIMLKGVWGDKTPCDCGYEDAWKALRDALGETK